MSTDEAGAGAAAPDFASVLSGAALLANLYGPRAEVNRVYDKLSGLAAQATYASEAGVAHSIEVLAPLRIDPPPAHDSSVVQLVLNSSGSVETAWSDLSRCLTRILSGLPEFTFWGYSVIYQAACTAPDRLDEIVPRLLPFLRSPGAAAPEDYLATQPMCGGKIWLCALPLQIDGLGAATVYLAIAPVEVERSFVGDALLGAAAKLLMPDLIAHKAYHQIRQYRLAILTEAGEDAFEKKVDETLDRGNLILRAVNVRKQHLKLAELSESYYLLNEIVTTLNNLRVSVHRQLANYERWLEPTAQQAQQDGIMQYHRSHIAIAVTELDLLVQKGRDALRTARLAVGVTQANLTEAQERRQERSQAMLAFLGVALAVPQLIDRDAATDILALVGVVAPANGYSFLAILGVQVGLTVLVALVVALAMKRISSPEVDGES